MTTIPNVDDVEQQPTLIGRSAGKLQSLKVQIVRGTRNVEVHKTVVMLTCNNKNNVGQTYEIVMQWI